MEQARRGGSPAPSVVTVGTYDGVHLGHQHLIGEARRAAAAEGLPVIVVTFDRLPAEVVRPSATPKLLTGLEHKLELLQATGVEQIVVLHFDLERATETAEAFVEHDLVGTLGARAIFVGTNFRFGKGASGDAELLEAMSGPHGFSAHGIELVTDDETKTVVSSSLVRAAVADGALEEARRLLGRRHEVRGTLLPRGRGLVVHGAFALPPEGRYEVEVGPFNRPGTRLVAVLPASNGPAAEVVIDLEASDEGPLPGSLGDAVALRFG